MSFYDELQAIRQANPIVFTSATRVAISGDKCFTQVVTLYANGRVEIFSHVNYHNPVRTIAN